MLWTGEIIMQLTNFNCHACTGEDHQFDGIEEENGLGVLVNSFLKFGTKWCMK